MVEDNAAFKGGVGDQLAISVLFSRSYEFDVLTFSYIFHCLAKDRVAEDFEQIFFQSRRWLVYEARCSCGCSRPSKEIDRFEAYAGS